MKKEKVLICCSIAVGMIILLLIGGGFFAYRYFISSLLSSRVEMPEELNAPGVVVGSGFLSKEIFVRDVRLGTITDIASGEFDPSPGPEIGIVGSKGALFLDENRNVKSSVLFHVHAGHVEMVDAEGDGICEYLDRGGGWQAISLIDHQGNPLWTYGGMPGVDDICAGDMDGDGILEFVVGFNGGGGVRLLDRNGKEKWRQPGSNVWHVELVDVDGDGDLEIVHSNAAGRITVRDGQGGIIRQAKPTPYVSHFSVCRWPSEGDRKYVLLAKDDTIWVLDFDGTSVVQFGTPISGKHGEARGVPVKLKSDQPEYFAVILGFSLWEKSILYLYGSNNSIVYQEIIPEACESIASMPLNSMGAETFLVGCNGRVWKYSVKK